MSQGVKTSKPHQQEQQQSANSFSEWAAAFQAYYGSGAQPPPHGAGYYAPATSGPQAHHPYIWGGQMMPYGAPPPPYPTMYPAGAMYHPSISPSTHPYGQFSTGTIPTPTSPGTTDGPTLRGKVPASSNGEAKTAEGNGSGFPFGNSVKRCKSNAALVPSASAGDTAKPGHNSGDAMSNSGDSGGSEDSSDSEDEPGQNGSLAYRKRTYDQNSAEASASVPGHGSTRSGSIVAAGNGGPTTTLGVSMDYWQNSTATSTPITAATSTKSAMVPKRAVTTGAVVPIPPPPPPLPPPAPSSMTSLVPAPTSHDGLQDLWYQDEREVKRQRRKQSNRESARRSRLRKQEAGAYPVE
ncbi:hypothetical protein CBR_g29470 [Chara braunii]|uniref:BZIP domain-containing protein n=1 Tax=Chara braunii TaxID=69332 RepID=A0A388LAH4_CHABU|nr:hypothetical protein CBR_g29470 [Chara braunii]|eukprot:GBG79321.1 hypothetical protein CBR_g29470 [Chara braunii]